MRRALVPLLLALAASPAAAAPLPEPSGVSVLAGLGAGAEIGRSGTKLVEELELGAGYDLGPLRPEATLVVGLAPGSYLGLRAGLHVDVPAAPIYARAALDWSHVGGDWHSRWLLVGAGTELSLTSVLAAFVEVDLGVPLTTRFGAGLLGRAGFTFRF